ncbi:MAG: MMPL family transporter [Planctomycetales bacterium]|nr:MMPL family transporter [Planctomycetales bacterium]
MPAALRGLAERLAAPMSRLASISRRPGPSLLLIGVLTVAAVPGVLRVSFEEDLTALFPGDQPEIRALATYRDLFAGGDSLLLLVRGEVGRDRLLAAGDALAQRLAAACPEARVRHRMDRETQEFLKGTFRDHAFLYLAPPEMGEARRLLSPDGIREAVAAGARRLSSPSGLAQAERFQRDPLGLGERVFFPAFRRSAGGALLDPESGAALSADGRALLLRVEGASQARDVPYSRDVVARCERAVAEWRAATADGGALQVTRAGGYLAAVRNEASIKRDLVLTSVTGVLGVLALFALACPPRLRGVPPRRALASLAAPHGLVAVPLGLGVLWTAGLAGWAYGRIGFVTAAFAAVLVGLAVDFPIHLLTRYRDERTRAEPAAALAATLAGTGPGLVAAAVTTAGAFLVLVSSSFRGLSEMGLLTAAGLVLCLVAVFSTAAFLYPRAEIRGRDPERSPFGAIGRLPRGAALAVLALAAAASAGAAAALSRPGLRFEEDLRRLATPGAEANETQGALAEAFGLSLDPLLLLTEAGDADAAVAEAARVAESLEGLVAEGRLASVLGPGSLLPSPERRAANCAALAEVEPGATIAGVRAALDGEGFDPAEFGEGLGHLEAALAGSRRGDLGLAALSGREGPLHEVLRARPAGGAVAATVLQPAGRPDGAARTALARDVAEAVARAGPGTVLATADLVVARLRDRLLPEVRVMCLVAGGAVALLTFFHFGRLGWTLLALVPVGLGLLWTAGAMAALGIPLTFFNVSIFPLILGIGVDDGIHVVSRYIEGGERDLQRTLAAVGLPVVMTSATTMMGFGSLVLAENPGLASLGAASSLGVGACLAASLLVLPALLRCR